MSKIVKDGLIFGGTPKEIVTAWPPVADGYEIERPSLMQSIIDMIYPVGSVYISTNSTSPTTLFGGSWIQIEDTFLLAAGNAYNAGDTGGEAEHVLTVNETPAHTHERGTMDITGKIEYNKSYSGTPVSTGGLTGAFSASGATGTQYYLSGRATGSGWPDGWSFKASDSWTGETSSIGGDEGHNNMPPYLVVYVWQRTA